MPIGMFALHANCWNYSVIIQTVKASLRSKWTSAIFWTCLLHLHVLEVQLCKNVLSSELVHEMHEMSNHNSFGKRIFVFLALSGFAVFEWQGVGNMEQGWGPRNEKMAHLPLFGNILLKTAWKWKNLDWEGHKLASLLDPPLENPRFSVWIVRGG